MSEKLRIHDPELFHFIDLHHELVFDCFEAGEAKPGEAVAASLLLGLKIGDISIKLGKHTLLFFCPPQNIAYEFFTIILTDLCRIDLHCELFDWVDNYKFYQQKCEN